MKGRASTGVAEVQGKLSSRWAVVPQSPLDYSFKDITSVADLEREEPRNAAAVVERKNDWGQKSVVTAIRLPNNRIVSIEALSLAAAKLVPSLAHIAWIDLSFNEIELVDKDILNFPTLTTLYLHANRIAALAELDKLAALPRLRTLTLHGNPVENAGRAYRKYVIARIPTLRHLDFCAITKQDRPWKKGGGNGAAVGAGAGGVLGLGRGGRGGAAAAEVAE